MVITTAPPGKPIERPKMTRNGSAESPSPEASDWVLGNRTLNWGSYLF